MTIIEKHRNICSDMMHGSPTKVKIMKNNRAMKKMNRLYNDSIKSSNDLSFMIELMNDVDVRVRINAAWQCIDMNIFTHQAKQVLEAIVDSKSEEAWYQTTAERILRNMKE